MDSHTDPDKQTDTKSKMQLITLSRPSYEGRAIIPQDWAGFNVPPNTL